MSSLHTDVFTNTTILRPNYFFISGFSGIPHTKYYYVFLCFVYALTVLGNTFVMLMISTDRYLHTPKYIVVFNLALSDLCESTTIVPQVIDTFLFKSHLISYEACMTNLFFLYSFFTMQSLSLTILSYDRCVAICFPLRYNDIVTYKSMQGITAISWTFAVLVTIIPVSFISKLSFCKSIVINSYFCDQGPLFRLACNDNTPNYVINWTHPIVILWLPVLFIIVTYICIARALLKIAAASERLKAIKTCSSHLVLVSVFYFPICFTVALNSFIHHNARIINLSLATTLPPMLNPIIYSMMTEEFTKSIKKLCRRNKMHIIIRKKTNKCCIHQGMTSN